MNDLIRKVINYETISYIVVGVLTTAVDYIVFAVVNESLKVSGTGFLDPVVIATIVSWVAAVAFAYIANKLAVFKNFNFSPAYLLKEAAGFVSARVMSGVIVLIFMWVAVSCCGMNEYIAKIISSAFNLIFNYVASKFFIFKNK
ncbi:MAG: GtrA family protein [Eubacteriales bacterium]|nr:GtrA family protein [Eubacteriales bacterium]